MGKRELAVVIIMASLTAVWLSRSRYPGPLRDDPSGKVVRSNGDRQILLPDYCLADVPIGSEEPYVRSVLGEPDRVSDSKMGPYSLIYEREGRFLNIGFVEGRVFLVTGKGPLTFAIRDGAGSFRREPTVFRQDSRAIEGRFGKPTIREKHYFSYLSSNGELSFDFENDLVTRVSVSGLDRPVTR